MSGLLLLGLLFKDIKRYREGTIAVQRRPNLTPEGATNAEAV